MHIKRKAKINISKQMYDHIVDDIEHDPLIRRSTLVVAGLAAFIAVLFGILLWYVQLHPAKLIRTTGTVDSLNSGRTDNLGTITTFVTFTFTPPGHKPVSVKAPVVDSHQYQAGEQMVVGYSPLNPHYARNLSHISPPRISVVLWALPPLLFFWFGVVALVRHHERQEEIFAAAEAANITTEAA